MGSNVKVNVADDPITMFGEWFDNAKASGIILPESMTVASASKEGRPSARVVLLKSFDEKGFVFYTNYESRKGSELLENPFASLVFHWNILQRQVRIEGRVEKVSEEESLAYFHSRPRGSQIGAWASKQSEEISERSLLERQVKEIEQRFGDGEIPLPPFWGGFRVVPDRIELWQGRADRLHDRYCFTATEDGWRMGRLSP